MQFLFGDQTVELAIGHVVNAGYAGCNQEVVKAHIDELAAIGVSVPGQVPTFYTVPALQLTQAEAIQVGHGQTSAEVEYVVIFASGKQYFTVGSDHSDRALEAYSVSAAKQICPNIIADEMWDYGAVSDHLDSVTITCEVAENGGWRVYQQGAVTELLLPDQLLEYGKPVMPGRPDGLVLYSGTIPTIGEITYGAHWRVTMADKVSGRTITKEYRVETLPPSME